eukprot:6144750-Alexandrium_andersonii.AAC.1
MASSCFWGPQCHRTCSRPPACPACSARNRCPLPHPSPRSERSRCSEARPRSRRSKTRAGRRTSCQSTRGPARPRPRRPNHRRWSRHRHRGR